MHLYSQSVIPSGYLIVRHGKIHSILKTVNHLFRLGPSIPWQTVNVITRGFSQHPFLDDGFGRSSAETGATRALKPRLWTDPQGTTAQSSVSRLEAIFPKQNNKKGNPWFLQGGTHMLAKLTTNTTRLTRYN